MTARVWGPNGYEVDPNQPRDGDASPRVRSLLNLPRWRGEGELWERVAESTGFACETPTNGA